jgi:hypothetical protein
MGRVVQDSPSVSGGGTTGLGAAKIKEFANRLDLLLWGCLEDIVVMRPGQEDELLRGTRQLEESPPESNRDDLIQGRMEHQQGAREVADRFRVIESIQHQLLHR